MLESPYFTQLSKELSGSLDVFKKKHPKVCSNCYPRELVKIFEKHIEVYGHAYCMDVPSERKKISKLLYNLLNKLSQ